MAKDDLLGTCQKVNTDGTLEVVVLPVMNRPPAYFKTPPDEHHMQRMAKILPGLVEELRTVARELGYAIGTHGSMVRDIDLIAVPWTNEAVSAAELAEALRKRTQELCSAAFLSDLERDEFFLCGCPGLKPHGRLTWSFHVGGGPYLDLSVMPRAQDYGKDPHWMPGIGFNEDRTTIWPPKIVNVG